MDQFRCYSRKSITVFFISVICLSAVAEYLICKCQSMWAYPLLMWMPAVSAVIASIVAIKGSGEPSSLKKLFSNTGFHFCKIRYVLAGILLPLVYLLIPYMIYWRMHPENFAYTGVPLLYCLIAFVLCIFPVGVICGLLAIQSGSVWPCAFLHAAHNNYDQAVFDLITKGADKMYYVSETGIFTIVCVWIIAIILYISFLRSNKNGTDRLYLIKTDD